MKKYWVKLSIILILIVGLFYWFSLRPAQIRKDCYNSAIGNPFRDMNVDKVEMRSELNFIYQNCLRSNGIEK